MFLSSVAPTANSKFLFWHTSTQRAEQLALSHVKVVGGPIEILEVCDTGRKLNLRSILPSWVEEESVGFMEILELIRQLRLKLTQLAAPWAQRRTGKCIKQSLQLLSPRPGPCRTVPFLRPGNIPFPHWQAGCLRKGWQPTRGWQLTRPSTWLRAQSLPPGDFSLPAASPASHAIGWLRGPF